MVLKSAEDIIREVQAKKGNNTHFILVDGMSNLLTWKVKKCQSSDFYAFGHKWNFQIISKERPVESIHFQLSRDDEKIENKVTLLDLAPLKYYVKTRPAHEYRISAWKTSSSWFKELEVGMDFLLHEDLILGPHIQTDKAVFCVEITPESTNIDLTTKGTAERLTLMEVPRNNSRFTWKITRFSSFTHESHSSYEFTAGQRRWRLKMYPKGDKSGAGYLSLYLTATDYVTNSPKAPTSAVYKLRVLNQLKLNNYEKNFEYLFPHDRENPPSCGDGKFLPLEELHKTSRGLLVNDEIYIGVEFLFISTCENL